MKTYKKILSALAFVMFLSVNVAAQTSAFTYQGKLTDGGAAANGLYDLAFKLFSQATAGTQVGSDVSLPAVQVSNGIMTVNLNFGAPAFSSGADRFLEISLRRSSAPSGTPYEILVPRQQITGSPFAIRSLNATSSDALSAACSLCVTDAHIASIDGSKVTGTVLSATYAQNVSGIVPVSNGGTGSEGQNFVDLSTDQRGIGGNKEFSGEISVGRTGRFIGDGSGLTNVNAAIADGSVTTPKIADGSVTTPKLADGSVTRAKLAVDFQNGFNPQNVALMRWDLLPVQRNSWTVGRTPSALAFDGTFMYVANKLDNNVQRIRTSTGAIEGGPIAVGTAPVALAFDGTFMYVANSGSNNVTRIRASTGVVEDTIAVGSNPQALAFDGTHMNVANFTSNTLSRIAVSTGAVGSIGVGVNPNGLVFDGTFIYVSHARSPEGVNGNILRIRASTGAQEGATITSIAAPKALAFDGTFVYVAQGVSVPRIRASTGIREAEGVATPGASTNDAIVFDGTFLYVPERTNAPSISVNRLDINGLGLDSSVPAVGILVKALAFDGTYVYAASDVTMIDVNGQTTVLNGRVIRF